MKYQYDNYSPISTSYIENELTKICSSITPSQLKWIADNREYGEKERYRKKADIENTLKGADIISNERRRIEEIFQTNELSTAVSLYRQLLYERMNELNLQYEEIFRIPHDMANLKKYWIELERISDLDNAHAMYLSSNNWEFSVFNDVIEELMNLLDNDFSKLNLILSAGVEDVRSTIFSTFENSWENITKDNFYERIIPERDFIRPNGICPFFAYISLVTPKVENSFDEEKYLSNLHELIDTLDRSKRELFERLYELYRTLYFVRIAYDTYEYFGYYAFVRHYAIHITYELLFIQSKSNANDFKRFASTYQFTHLKNILT